MERNENVMLRWMCGVTLRDQVPTVELRRRFGIEGVVEVMKRTMYIVVDLGGSGMSSGRRWMIF